MSSLAEKRLIVKIVEYFRSKLTSEDLQADQKESLEVGLQCIESTFNVNLTDPALQSNIDLVSIFSADTNSKVPSDAEKAEAEKLKNLGNDLMKDNKFEEAVSKYTDAIKLHANPIFFCNRAAAYSKLDRHRDAVEDCKVALQLDPSYSKAFGRMGLAHSCMGSYEEARNAYKKAVELEPTNDGFQNNLRVAEEKLAEAQAHPQQQAPGFPGFPGFGGAGTGNFLDMLNNPVVAQMAQQMMTDPAMQNLIGNMFGAGLGQAAPNQPASGQSATAGQPGTDTGSTPAGSQPNANTGAPGAGMNLNSLLEMGQQFANMMQQRNPELVEQLRRQFQQEHGQHDDPQNPPPPNPPPS